MFFYWAMAAGCWLLAARSGWHKGVLPCASRLYSQRLFLPEPCLKAMCVLRLHAMASVFFSLSDLFLPLAFLAFANRSQQVCGLAFSTVFLNV